MDLFVEMAAPHDPIHLHRSNQTVVLHRISGYHIGQYGQHSQHRPTCLELYPNHRILHSQARVYKEPMI